MLSPNIQNEWLNDLKIEDLNKLILGTCERAVLREANSHHPSLSFSYRVFMTIEALLKTMKKENLVLDYLITWNDVEMNLTYIYDEDCDPVKLYYPLY